MMIPVRVEWVEDEEPKNAGDGVAGDVGVGISSVKTEDETD